MDSQWNRIKEIFQQAMDRLPHERRAFLIESCAGDERLQEEVESLIKEIELSADFMERSPELPESIVSRDSQRLRRAPVGLLGSRYQINSCIGAGGVGEVYLAHDTMLDRRVAIKFLQANLQEDASARERFRREALAAAGLDHPFICKVFEIGDVDGSLFIVMEFLEGETLQALARQGLMSLRRIVEIASELVEALEEAHHRGVVHRDLKPSNVMVTPQGHVKVMDFGLAKRIAPAPAQTDAAVPEMPLTKLWTLMGTPAYMSPEQILGGSLDGRSDIFSLGVILSELVTGRHPFMREDVAQTMASILRDPPMQGDRDPESLPGLGAILHRMLAKACAERTHTMGELGLELEALRDRAWASATSLSAGSESPQQAQRTPFVGRETETAELTRQLDRMLQGQGGLTLIGGELGVGKTRLAQELLQEARRRRCLCLIGHCYEMEGAPPFVPFIEMTEQAVRAEPQMSRAVMGEYAPEIASLVPRLRRIYADIPPMPEVPAGQQRRLVFSAYLEYVQRCAQKLPIVMFFDDLHWADDPTLQLLQHVTAHLASIRMLIIGTYRDVDVNRPFARSLEMLLRQRLATRITLRRLNESGVQKMLSAMSPSTPPSGLAHAVFRETEGNPFFVEEVYQHLAEEGKLFEEDGAWKADLKVGSIEVPEGVRLVVGRRLERLGKQARSLLTAAAVIGRTFPIDLVQAVVDMTEDEVLDAIDDAERAQLLAPELGQRIARYTFVHELIRTTLVSGLSLPRRQRLHVKIADALERLRAPSLDSYASVLAYHLYEAGAAADAQRTARSLLLAGRRAITVGAFEEAQTAVDHIISLELPDDDPMLAEVFEHRGAALFGLQQADEAAAAQQRALTLYAARHQDAGIERVARAVTANFLWRGRISEAAAVLTDGLQALSHDAARERASLHAYLSLCDWSLSDLDGALQRVDQAVNTAQQLADMSVLSRALWSKSYLHRMSDEPIAAVEAGRRALGLLGPGAVWDRAELFGAVAIALFDGGRFSEIDALLPELEATANRAGHHGVLWLHERIVHSREAMNTGNLRTLLAQSEQALRGSAQWALPNRNYTAVLRLYLGQVDEALDEFRAVVAEQPDNFWFKGMPEANLFCGSALAGRVDQARTLLPAMAQWLPTIERRHHLGAWFALQASVTGLALLGDRERCGALYPVTLAKVANGTVVSGNPVGPANPQLVAAIAADAAGLTEKARGHFEAAARQARDLPNRILQPTVQYWYGRLLSAHIDPVEQSRGRAMIASAAADFHRLEMVLHSRLASDFLASAAHN